MRLKNKVALITGAASGFGAGMARRFIAEGAKVVIADIQEGLGRDLAAELGDDALYSECDVTDSIEISNSVKTSLAEFGGLDIVINNAGYTHENAPLLEVEEAEFDRIFDVNFKSLYLMTKATLPVFRKQGHGVYLNVASTAGVRPRPGLVWYNASKSAVIGVTKSMAIELAPEQIRVNAINPVAGETPLLARFMGEDSREKRAEFEASIPLGRLSQPQDVAAAAVYLCSEEANMVTGVALDVDGGRCL